MRNVTVGIDLGTAVTRTVVLSWQKNAPAPEIVASVQIPSKGMRHGYIAHIPDAAASIRKCVSQAEQLVKMQIKQAVFSLGGISISSENTTGTAVISKSDGEVTSFDVKKALADAENSIDTKNRRVIYSTPIGWKLDGKEILGKPEGMHGVKLEVRIFCVTALAQHLDDLLSAASEAGIEVVDVVPSSIAASVVALTERQKAVGVLLANIGAETVSTVVFEGGMPIGLSVFPVGSTNITNDIALGFRIPLEEAESIKVGSVMTTTYPKRKIDEIITARFSDIFELIDNYLKKIKRSGLLPAGIVITGGGSAHALVEGLAKEMLRLPSRIGTADALSQIKGPVRDSSWFVAYGLAHIAHDISDSPRRSKGDTKGIFKEFLRQFLP